MTGEKKNTGIVEILDFEVYNNLINTGKITDDKNNNLFLIKYRNNIKIKKSSKKNKYSYF